MSESSRTFDRILGCILGGALGDALGGRFEGADAPEVIPEAIDDELWRLSDDTQLTLATCEGIVEARGAVDPAVIAARFAAWHRAGRVTGMGSSTLGALAGLAQGGHWALVGGRGERAAGNGAAMRSAPLAFFVDMEDPLARRTLRDVSRITHHSDEAYAGALAIATAVRAAWTGAWTGEATLLGLVMDRLPDTATRDRVSELAGVEQELSLRELAARFGRSGWVVESVPLALCAAQRVRTLGFEAMLREVVSVGGDADTLASMAGQIAGTLLGQSGLPAAWLARLPERDLIERTAGALAGVAPPLPVP